MDGQTAEVMQTNSAQTDLLIQGMSCGNCARHVTEALQAVPGVATVAVSVEQARGTVTWQCEPRPDAAVAALQAAGYEARLPTA